MNWTRLDKDDKSTWPPEDTWVYVASHRDKYGGINIGAGLPMYMRDMKHMYNPFKWEDRVFFKGPRFAVCYWRPLNYDDFPPVDL